MKKLTYTRGSEEKNVIIFNKRINKKQDIQLEMMTPLLFT